MDAQVPRFDLIRPPPLLPPSLSYYAAFIGTNIFGVQPDLSKRDIVSCTTVALLPPIREPLSQVAEPGIPGQGHQGSVMLPMAVG